MKPSLALLAASCAAVLFFAFPAVAQQTRGTIAGRVTDASGAVVPGASVKAVNTQTGVAVVGKTNSEGSFQLLYLSPGTYDLTVEMTGFKKYERTGITLRVDDELNFPITIQPGQITESVTVSGTAPLLETSVSQGQVVDHRRITELPLAGADAYTLAQLSPGVVNFGVPNHPELAPAVEVVSNIGVNGVPAHNTDFSLDGTPSMWGQNASFVPPADMISEFKVETTRYDAASQAPGGSVNVALRSGTNGLHGTLWETNSNQHLEGLDFFQRRQLYNLATGPVNKGKIDAVNPHFVINHFSATLGGPVVIPKVYNGRNRTFWMYGFEGLIRPSEERGDYYHTVPTLAERTGDFSQLLAGGAQYQIYNPYSTVPAGNGRFSRQPLPGNILPTSLLNPTAQKLMQYYPAPNTAGLIDGEQNYFNPLSSYNQYYSHTIRIDHNFGDKNRMFGRYNEAHQLFDSGETLPNISNGNHRNRYDKGVGLDDVYIASPQFLVDMRYSMTRFNQVTSPFGLGFNLAGAGFSPTLLSQISAPGMTFPQISIDGNAYAQLGNSYPSGTYQIYHILGVDFTRMAGKHTIRFGVEYRLYRAFNNTYTDQTPAINFGTEWTVGPLDNSPAAPIGQGLASFMLGLPTGGTGQVNASYAEQSTLTAGYIQDEFKVTSRLTLNFGLRYEYETAPTERYNRSVLGFDFTTPNPIQAQAQANYALNPIPQIPVSSFQALGGLTFAGANGGPRSLWQTDNNDFAPRLGLAYQLPHNFVIRAGYGIYYITNGIDRLGVNQAGFTQATNLIPSLDNGQTYVATLTNPFPNGYQQPLGATAGLSSNVGRAVSFFEPTRPHPYAQHVSFGIQKQISNQTIVEVSYVGTGASRLDITRQIDPVPAQYLSTSPVRDQPVINFLTAAVPNPFYPLLPGTGLSGKNTTTAQLLHPYPQFTGITAAVPAGYSWYHSLQVRAERRFHNGFTIQGNYTFSKYLAADSYLNPTDANPTYAISEEDCTHRFTATGLWELPFGTGRKFGATMNRVPRFLVSGWQLQATYEAQSGFPLGGSGGWGDVLYYGNPANIALPVGQRSTSEWFNTANFDRLPANQLLDNIRTFPLRMANLRAQGVNLWNASVLRDFQIREGKTLEFRSEWLNATNHSFFAAPNLNPTAAAFGDITATNGFPRQIYFALKLLF